MKKLLVAFISLTLLSACTRTEAVFDDFAQCLTDKGIVMWGANSCPHCKAQKADFKGSFDLVTYVDCDQEIQRCIEEGIEGYPTWEIDGKRIAGKKSLSELSELTGCPLN